MGDIDRRKETEDSKSSDAEHSAIQKSAPDQEGDPGTGMARQAHGDLAAVAAAQLERSGGSLESLGGEPQEIERQAACLIDWAFRF